jgi:hypothetical protein
LRGRSGFAPRRAALRRPAAWRVRAGVAARILSWTRRMRRLSALLVAAPRLVRTRRTCRWRALLAATPPLVRSRSARGLPTLPVTTPGPLALRHILHAIRVFLLVLPTVARTPAFIRPRGLRQATAAIILRMRAITLTRRIFFLRRRLRDLRGTTRFARRVRRVGLGVLRWTALRVA